MKFIDLAENRKYITERGNVYFKFYNVINREFVKKLPNERWIAKLLLKTLKLYE